MKRKLFRKMTAVLLALMLALNLSALNLDAAALESQTIAAWDYTAAPAGAIVPATSGALTTGTELTNFKGATPTYSSGSLSINGWDNGADTKYWQISLSSKGYDNLTLAAKVRSSGTGPRDFKVIYSTDNGANWVDVINSGYAVTGTTLSNYMPAISLPLGASDAEKLLIRFIMTSNISSRAGTSTYPAEEVVGSGGTSNINNILISGTPVTNATTVAGIAATPANKSTVALNSKVALTCDTEGATIMYSLNGSEFAAYDPNEQVTLAVLPATIKAFGTKEGLANSVITTYSYVQGQVAAVNASPNGGAVALNVLVTLSCDTPNAITKYSMDEGTTWNDYTAPIKLTVLPTTIKAYATATGLLDSAKATFSFTQKENVDYNIYFGQLHSHTTYSDGLGTVDDAYGYAKNTAKVDFLAVTDHSNSFDNASTSNITNGSPSTEWIGGHTAADTYTDASFVGIYAYEMTWSNGTGHINTFNTLGFENRDATKYKAVDGLKQYYDVLKTVPDSISQLNHPGTTFGDFNDFANYDPQIDKQISLIEVGNGEGAIGSRGYFPSYEFYTRALDKGWHVSPTNNQDNHLGKWGDANTAKTVILADSLTRDNIYDAMRNMRTYATEDKNLRIKYTLNGEVMGTIFEQKPDSVNIKVDLEDPDNEAIGNVSVIANGGKVVASQTVSASKETVEFTLDPNDSYYYIRVYEADSDIAVTAPIWIGEVVKAGISKTTADTTLPIKGKSLNITTSLFNNENYPLEIQSLSYSIDGNVIHETTSMAPISSLNTGSYSFGYTPDSSGKFNIDVKLVATLNGVEKIFTDVLKLDVTDPALVTRVVADGSHFNDYVNGYYANNLGNFTAIANSEKIAVDIEKTKLTDDLLTGVKLLVISAPAKKAGTANGVSYQPQSFSDEDIAVVKRYVDNGGNLLVCGIADYQDGTGVYQTTTQMNALLEAIGATSRFNNDEVIDNTQKLNNQNFRLAFDDYNMDSPYLNGVQPGQTYSFYSGCSIGLDQAALNSGKTTWLVKGHDTTESIDSNTNLAGVALPQGSVYALAVEQLDGGGNMFIGGTVYISNFEVKAQLDNASQMQNSNYNITMNILDSIKTEMPVTSISQVRSAQGGQVFSVEGIVTAGKSVVDNSFFDTLYIQDATAGINIFPVSANNISVGQKVKVIGTVDEYQGDKELRVIEYSITDSSINPISPTVMTTKASMEPISGGMLVKIEGIVKSKDNQNLYIDDGSGTARVFVDGYIGDGTNDSTKLGKWDSRIQVGDRISAIGLASMDPLGARLRVRNTAEIVWIQAHQDNSSGDSTPAANPTNPVTTKETSQGTATIAQSEGGNTVVVLEVKTDKLNSQIDAATSDKITIDAVIDRNANEVTINMPADLIARAAEKDIKIEVNTGTAIIMIDPSTITIPDGAKLSLKAAAISTEQAKLILSQTGDVNYNITSAVYDFDLVTIKDNKETKVEFSEPLSVAISFDQSKVANVNKLGIYYYNETTKTWEYSGGRITGDGQISFDAEHFSKYTVMEYNKTFGDVNIPWAKEAIEVMASRHIIDGIGGDKFAPNDNVTRAQFAKMLVKALNLKAANSNVKFTDVKPGDWYQNYVIAAANAGITNGSNGKFEPELEITREMMATMIVRAMNLIKPDTNLSGSVVNFTDKDNISDWAKHSVEIAYGKGLINGITKNTLEPKAATTRAQAAVMIYRLLEAIGYVK